MNFDFKTDKIRHWLAAAGRFLQTRPFAVFLLLVFLSFAAAGLFFYLYAYNIQPASGLKTNELKIDSYKDTIEWLKNREVRIQEGMQKSYPDIFQ